MALKAFGQVFAFVQRKIYGCCRCAPTQTQSLTRRKKHLFFLQIKKANCPKSHVEFSLVMNEMSFKEGMTDSNKYMGGGCDKMHKWAPSSRQLKTALSLSDCEDACWGKKQLIQQICFFYWAENKKKTKNPKSKCGGKWIMVWGQPEISKMTF